MRPDQSRQTFTAAVSAALNGARFVWHEPNIKRQLVLFLIALIIAFVLQFSLIEIALVLVCAGGVFGTEVLNTALEHTLDIVDPQINPQVKTAKDIAAFGVVVWAIASVLVEACLIIAHLMRIVG